MIHHLLPALLLVPFLSAASLAATDSETDPPPIADLALIDDGPVIGGWLEASYNDFAGNFDIGRNRIRLKGDFSDYSYEISIGDDDASSSVILQDAYATTSYGSVGLTFGQFRAPTTSGHLVTESHQFFLDRTGSGGDGLRQTGLMASGTFDSFGWTLAVMDDEGDPDVADDDDEGEDLHARVTFDVIGSAQNSCEGSYGSLGTTSLSVAAALDNGNSGDTTYLEAIWTSGPYWAYVELVDADTGSPMTLAATYAINTQYEVGLRSEDPDDGNDTTMSIAVSRYVSGHDCKWTLQFDDGGDYDGTGSTDDGQRLSAGFLVGF